MDDTEFFLVGCAAGVGICAILILAWVYLCKPRLPCFEAERQLLKDKEKSGDEELGCCDCFVEDEVDDHSMDDVPMEVLEDQFVNSGVIEDISIVVGIDVTRSNKFKGRKCFGGRNLHQIDKDLEVDPSGIKTYNGEINPYESAILAAEYFLKTDTNFPLYYFGSVEAAEMGGYIHVRDCEDFMDLWHTYRETIETQVLSGPGRFVPLLERTIERVKQLNRYHILLIFTDGDVEDEAEFGEALAAASQAVPLSVVVVGIGDGPFDQIEKFDDHMPATKHFDNMQFTSFNEVVGPKVTGVQQKKEFYRHAFNEIPRQYRACKNILGYRAPMRRVGHFEEPVSMDYGNETAPRGKPVSDKRKQHAYRDEDYKEAAAGGGGSRSNLSKRYQ